MDVRPVSSVFAREFLNMYHPLGAGGSLRGAKVCLVGCEEQFGWPVFVAVFVSPRSRWKNYNVSLELARLSWSPLATRSAATFLRKCLRVLRRYGTFRGLVVTYALPGSSGVLYTRSGFWQDGHSSGCSWGHRGPGERATPDTVGHGQKLKRFFASLERSGA